MDTPSSMDTNFPPKPERMATSPRTSSSFNIGAFAFPIIQNCIWAIAHALSCFLLQITELFAPFLLLIGLGWSAIPQIINFANNALNNATSDQQTKDLVEHVTHSVPMQLKVSGHLITPHALIMDGILLMIVAALASTSATWLGRRL